MIRAAFSAHLKLRPYFWYVAQVHSAIVYPKQLMNHSLIGPLRQERRDGVIPPINQQEYGWSIRLPEVKQLLFLRHRIPQLRRQLPAQQAVLLKPDQWLLLECEKQCQYTFGRSRQTVVVPAIRRRAEDARAQGKAAEIRIDDDEVCKVLNDALYDLMVIRFG